MKIYLVGGAIRDKLLGLPVKERDYVVVNATVQDMLSLGFKQVGKEFPVFLHPKTGEEYALARMEKKIDLGYKGFSFDTSPTVTLEEDLKRRDLTINAMAESEEGELIDPYHGNDDLNQGVLRHISVHFAEDPVRILRVGRFLARYSHLGFKVAPETMTLMQQMVQKGEVDALVAERVWKELERALGEKNPELFFNVLEACHALPILFPALVDNHSGFKALLAAAAMTREKKVRFAALLHHLPQESIKYLCKQYRVPIQFSELAMLSANFYREALTPENLSVEALLNLLTRLDYFRRSKRFYYFLETCTAIARSLAFAFHPDWWLQVAEAAKGVDITELLNLKLSGPDFAEKLRIARCEKINTWLKNSTKK